MTQAITVKYLGPTNTRGARLKATCRGGSITEGRDFALNVDEQAAQTAKALCVKLGWGGRYACGGLPNGDYVFVQILPEGHGADQSFTA